MNGKEIELNSLRDISPSPPSPLPHVAMMRSMASVISYTTINQAHFMNSKVFITLPVNNTIK